MALNRKILTLLLVCITPALCGRYSGTATAQADGDDPSASGLLTLTTTRNSLTFTSTLFNAFNVTGVHLHLQPSRGTVFGGPLILALTNTTAANGLAPVSSSGGQPLVQNGQRTSANLAANPMLPAVRAKLAELGVTGNNVETIGDVANLIEDGLVYTDVHTTVRVSPNGLVRGVISELACAFPTASAPSTPATPTPPASPTPPATPATPATPPPASPTPPASQPPLSNPCYCSPQQGVGRDGYQYCFNFDQATTNINCTPPAGAKCQVLSSISGFNTNPGPVFQCTY